MIGSKEVPSTFQGFRLVKCYKNYALYENDYYKTCFRYQELNINTSQMRISSPQINKKYKL